MLVLYIVYGFIGIVVILLLTALFFTRQIPYRKVTGDLKAGARGHVQSGRP